MMSSSNFRGSEDDTQSHLKASIIVLSAKLFILSHSFHSLLSLKTKKAQ